MAKWLLTNGMVAVFVNYKLNSQVCLNEVKCYFQINFVEPSISDYLNKINCNDNYLQRSKNLSIAALHTTHF